MTCSKNYQFFKVLKVFLPAGFNGKFENYEPGKNIKTCDIADIVPAATDHFPIKNAPKKGESVGRFDEKNMKHDLLKPSNWTGAEVRRLVYMLILDHMFANVY